MKILIVNKFLYPHGGSETYALKIGKFLKEKGHEVEYFGMEDRRNIVGNSRGAYTSNMDFHTGKWVKFLYPFKIIYSVEARKKIREVLESLNPDVVHLNNFYFQITPSILYEIKKFEKVKQKRIKIVFTAHDYHLICPNHMLRRFATNENCERCVCGDFFNCISGKCIHGSIVKSSIGCMEAYVYKFLKTYRFIDIIICPTAFMKSKLDRNRVLRDKTMVLHNFIDEISHGNIKKDYVLYFGRYSKEKGIETLIEVCKQLTDIPFIFAGTGPLEEEINKVCNIRNMGFMKGEELYDLIAQAKFSICPSEWYENCPFSVMESIMYGTPVLGADIGGIPELIEDKKNGELFISGDKENLSKKIKNLWVNKDKCKKYVAGCQKSNLITIEEYYQKLIGIYKQHY